MVKVTQTPSTITAEAAVQTDENSHSLIDADAQAGPSRLVKVVNTLTIDWQLHIRVGHESEKSQI